ncbi:MAG: hypothetical protein UHI81_09585 [Olegusella sp.]|nr:hypothetical protein [Olegusella sp.]
MGSDGLVRIGRGDAERLIATFLPMIDWLDAHGVDYCLVGGLGVVVQSYASGLGTFRATEDADVMFDTSFTNQDFARAYLGAYAADPAYGGAVYDAMFGDGAFAGLADEAQALVNASFVGADEDLDGVSTPDFDVVRRLNGIDLASIERESVEVMGGHIKVATARQLLEMKEATISLLHADALQTARPQDFVDAARLCAIIDGLGGERRFP